MQGIKKNMGEWHLPEKKKLEVGEGGQYKWKGCTHSAVLSTCPF